MKSKYLKFLSFLSGIVGIGILLYVFVPLFLYQISARIAYPTLLKPLADGASKKVNQLAASDFTKASNWFEDGKSGSDYVLSKVTNYTISIPALGIKDAVAAIGGEDLSESLIQYPGTALPGKVGNAVIFGHSILPIFYNPESYLAIFSTLPSIKVGDTIMLNFDGVGYIYEVQTKFEVAPTDIQILEQDKSDSFLTLVTCTPPGDPRRPKRLIVRAKIVSNGIGSTNANTWN